MNETMNHLGIAPSTEQFRPFVLVSLAGHAVLVLGFIVFAIMNRGQAQFIVAAGGDDGAEAFEVGVATESEVREFLALMRTESLGDQPDQLNTARYKQAEGTDEAQAELLLSKEKEKDGRQKVKTERPVSSFPARPYSPTEQRGAALGTSGLIGPSLGQTGLRAGVGLGPGDAGTAGIPGGSDYGRRLQQALIGYYRFSPASTTNQRFVIIRLTISRTGRIVSVVNGRLNPSAFIQRSGNPVIDSRVEAALLELNRSPIPFPPDFLPGVREAVADIYFQY